jgi:hypothetical protein
METLTVTVCGNVWGVKHEDPKIIELFGTDTLPTPYTLKCPLEVVISNITTRNPNKAVKLSKAVHLYDRGVITLEEACSF